MVTSTVLHSGEQIHWVTFRNIATPTEIAPASAEQNVIWVRSLLRSFECTVVEGGS